MSRAHAVARRATGVLAAVPVVLAGASWHALAAAVMAVLIVAAAGCWVLASSGRTRRLALLIGAWRGNTAPGRQLALARSLRGGPGEEAAGRQLAE